MQLQVFWVVARALSGKCKGLCIVAARVFKVVVS